MLGLAVSSKQRERQRQKLDSMFMSSAEGGSETSEGGWSYEDVSSKCADQSFDVGDKLSGLCGELKEGSGSRLGEYEMVGLWIEKAITLSISSTHRARERGF